MIAQATASPAPHTPPGMIRTRLAVLVIVLVALSELAVFVAVNEREREAQEVLRSRADAHAPATQGWTKPDHAIVDAYLASHPIRKLQVGAGTMNLEGWLNTDIQPSPGQVFLDATKPLPFPDGSFRYVYGEQVIEHITFDQGLAFLKECHRVLEPGGRVRLATPNLLRVLDLFNAEKTPVQKHVMDFAIDLYHLSHIPRPETTTLNLMVRAWGHQFLYDPESLHAALTAAGFAPVVAVKAQESEDPALQNIEMHWRIAGGKDIDDYVSQFVEGVRSGSPGAQGSPSAAAPAKEATAATPDAGTK